MRSNLIKKFKNFLWREGMFSGGEKLVVGISGGADSVCLVKLLLVVKDKFDLELLLVHINYHLRGEDSDSDEKFVREFAKREGLELEVVDYNESNVKCQMSNVFDCGINTETEDKYAKKEMRVVKNGNLEERLRDFRYKVFEQIRTRGYFSGGSTTGNPVVEPPEDVKSNKFDWIAVGHHQDDQAETFLLNLFRGAGIDGLKGMLLKDKEKKLLRPLLNFSKKEILDFLQSIGQKWREDKSNQDISFLRNKIRHQLIPEIEKEYSSQFKQRVSVTTKQLQEYQIIIKKVVEENYNKIILEEDLTKVVLDVAKYKKLPTEVKPLVFRQVIKNLKGDLRNITGGNYQEFQKIIQSTKGKKQKISFGGIEIENNKKEIIFRRLKKCLVFGTFDILHPGHLNFFEQAKRKGGFLTVVVARDENVKKIKRKIPRNNEKKRRQVVKECGLVDRIVLGNKWGNNKDRLGEKNDRYRIIAKERPDIICLGYDQKVDVKELKNVLREFDLKDTEVVRLKAYQPEKYKSSLLTL